MKRQTKKTRERRQSEREGFEEFYQEQIQRIKDNQEICSECKIKLIGDVSEVAHVLPKRKYKTLSTSVKNVIFLCGYMQNNCHGKFDDSPNAVFQKMKVFPIAQSIVKEFLEKGLPVHWKVLERYKM